MFNPRGSFPGQGLPPLMQPRMNQPGMNVPGMNQSNMGLSGMNQSSMGLPGMGLSGMNQKSMGLSGMNQPSMGLSGMNQPSMGFSGMNQPSMGLSGMNQPSMGLSGMNQPSMGLSGMNQPNMGLSGMNQPIMGLSGMNQPSMGLSGMNQSSMGQSGMNQPSMGHSGMNQSSMGHSGMNQSNMGLSGMGHSGMNPQGMGHSGMNPQGMGHSGMNPQGMGHSGMNPQGMGHSGMNPQGMGHSGMNPQGMGHSGMNPQGMGLSGMNQQGMGHSGMNRSGNLSGGIGHVGSGPPAMNQSGMNLNRMNVPGMNQGGMGFHAGMGPRPRGIEPQGSFTGNSDQGGMNNMPIRPPSHITPDRGMGPQSFQKRFGSCPAPPPVQPPRMQSQNQGSASLGNVMPKPSSSDRTVDKTKIPLKEPSHFSKEKPWASTGTFGKLSQDTSMKQSTGRALDQLSDKRYSTESASSILESFGLSNEDLEELSRYPDDQLTPSNMPVILRDIRMRKMGRSGTSPDQGGRARRSGGEVLPSKVIDYGHSSKYRFEDPIRSYNSHRKDHTSDTTQAKVEPKKTSLPKESAAAADVGSSKSDQLMDNKIPTISNTRKSPASRSGSKVVRSQVKTIFGEQSEQTAGNPPEGASSSSEKNVGAEVMTKAQQDAQKGPPNYQAPLQTPPPSGVSGSWTPSLAQADIQKNRNPTPSMMNDYYASSPRLFPHICSLCSIECGHLKDWITHQNTPGHIESCRKIRIQYPQWNPHVLAPIRHDDNKSDGGSSKRSRSISPRRSRGSGPRGRPRRSRSKSPRKSGRTRSRSRSPRRPRRSPNRSRNLRRRSRSPRRSLSPKRPRRAWASRMNSYSPDKRAVDAAVASFIESTKVKSGDKIPTRASSNGRKESPKSSTTRARDKQSDSSTTLSKKTVSPSSTPRKTGSVSSASSSKKSSSMSAKKPTSGSSSRITPSSSTSSNKPSSSSSTAKKPASSSSTAKKPASSSSTAKKPASSSSTAKKPASSSSTAKKPASSSSTAKKPASSPSTAKKPAFSSSTAKKPTPGFFSNKNDTNSARKVTPDGKKPFQAKKTPAHAHPKASSADVFNPLHKFKTKTTGTIIHVTNLPDSDYTDQDIMKIVQPFGKVSDILIIRSKNEAYLQTNFKEAASAAVEFSESVPVMVNKTRVKLSLAGHKKEPAAAVPVVKKQENPKKEEENKPCDEEEEEAAEAAVAEMVVQEKCEKETKPRPKTKLPEVIPPGFMKVYKLAEPKFQDTEKCVIVVSNLPEGQQGVEEISNLAKPFGGVVDIIFVSTHRKVYLQLSSKSSADSMIKFYSAFPTFISGNSLSIAVNPKFKDLKDEDRIFAEIVEQSPYKIKPTIYERFVHLNNLPEKGYTEFEVACVGLRFGKVEHYVIFANKRKAILHMSCVSAARAMRNFLSQYPCFIADCVVTCALSSKVEMAEDEYVSTLEPVKKSEAEGAPDDTETAQTADDEAAKGGVKAETSADNVPASSDNLNTPASPTPPEAAPPAVPTPETTEPETTPEAEDESQAVDPAPVEGSDEEHMAVDESPVEQSTETEESMQTDSELTEPTEQATHEQPDDSEMVEQEASDTALEIAGATAVSEDEDCLNDDGDEDDGDGDGDDDDGDDDEEAAEAPDTPVGAMPEWGHTEIVAPAEESEPVVEYNVPECEDLEVLVTVESDDEEEEEPHLGFLGSTLCKSFQLQAKTAEASAMDNISSTACDEAEDLVGVTVDPEAEDCEMLESTEPSEALNVDMEESEEPKSPEQLSPVQTDAEASLLSTTPEPSPNLKDTQKKVLKDQSLTNTEPVTPTGKGDAGNVTPTGKGDAGNVTPSVKGDAGNVTPTGKGDAGNVTPTGKGDAGNVTPTGKGDAGNVTPTGKGDAVNDKEAKLEDAPASVSAKKARDSRPSESSTKDSGDSKPLSPLSRTAKYNPHRGELSVTVTLDSQRSKSGTRKWPSAERRSSGREGSTPKSSNSRSSPTETSQSNPKSNQSSQKKTAGKSVPSQQDRESKGASKPWEREARSNPRKDDRSKNPPPKYVRSSKGSSRGSKSNEDQGSDQFPFNLEEFVTVDEIVEEQADIRCVKITPAAGKKEKRKEPERSPSEVRKVKGKSMGAHSARKESFVTLDEVGDDDSPPGPDSDLMHEPQSLATVDEVHNDEDQPAFEKVSQDLMTLDEVSDEEDISQVNNPDFAEMPDDLSKEPLLVTLDEVHEEEDEMPSKPKPFDPAKPGAEGGGDRKAAKGNNKAFSNISEDPSDDITEQPLLTLDEVKGDDDGDDDMDSFNEASQFLTVDEVGEEEEDSSVSADTVTETKDKTHKTPEQSEDKTDCEPVPAAQTPVTPRRGRPRKRPLDVESSPAPAEVKPKVSTQQSPAPKTQNVTTQQTPAPKTQQSPAPKTQQTPAPKTQQTPAPKTQQTPAPKTQQTPAPKTQQTPAPKTQQTPAPKTQQTPAPKTQQTPAPKTQQTPAPKTQQTPAPKTQQTPAPKTQQTPAPKTQQTPAPKTQQTPAPKTQQTPAPKTQQTPAPKTQQTPAPKTQQTPAPKTQQTPAPKTQQTPAPKTQQNVKAVSAETDKASPASYETPSKKKKTEAAPKEGAKLAPFNPSTPTETHGQRGAGARLDNRKNQLKANIATKRT